MSGKSNLKIQGNKSLTCPFTWDIDDNLSRNYNEDYELTTDYEEQPVLALIDSIMIIYLRSFKENYRGAIEKIQETTEFWKKLNQRKLEEEDISIDVLFHIIEATKFYVYKAVNNTDEAEKIMTTITDAKDFRSNLQIGTINGCISIAWMTFHNASHETTINFSNKAVSKSPKCPLWYFVLGKSHRSLRRYDNFSLKPSNEEMESLLKCTELSDNLLYKMYVAQMYKDNGDIVKSMEIYQNCYEQLSLQKQKDIGIQLRLAKAFTTSKDFAKAKTCLDYAEQKNPKNAMFIHYKGIYFEKTKDLKKAAEYYKNAAEYEIYGADLQYALCMVRLNKNFKLAKHFEMMLEKYKSLGCQQQTLLHLGMFHHKMHQLENAAVNFLKSIQLNEQSNQLKCYRNITGDWKTYDIFKFIHDRLLPELEKLDFYGSEHQDTVQKLKEICGRHEM